MIFDVQLLKRTAPPSPNDNQSIKGKQNPRIVIIWYHFFRLAFVFSIISLNLPGFQLTSSPLSPFSWIYTLIYAVVQNITKCLFYNYSHFNTHFATNLFYLHSLKTETRLWKNNRTVQVNKRNKNKNRTNTSHSNWPRVLRDFLAHKQCNGIIKGWLHCLMSESKGRFLANNILLAY